MLFWRLSARYAWAHRVRTALTIVGISLGVAAVTAVTLMDEAVSQGFTRTIERLVGKAVLQVANGEGGVPEELLDEVAQTPGVSRVEASVHGFVPVVGDAGETLYILGVDLLAGQALREYALSDETGDMQDPVLFLAQPDSVAVSTRFLEENGLEVEDHIVVRGPLGSVPLTIRATLDLTGGFAALFGGRLAVMDLFAAQQLFDLGDRFSQLDVGVEEGVAINEVERALRSVVAGRGVVGKPQERGASLNRLMSAQRCAMVATSVSALLIGVILTFGTMVIAVAQRRRQIAVLRMVGMRRGEVFRLILLEALCFGAIAALIGVPLGQFVAHVATAGFGALVQQRFLLPLDTSAAGPSGLGPLFWGMILGPGCALLGALAPARETLRVNAAGLMSPSLSTANSFHASGKVAVAGLVTLAVAALAWVLRDRLDPILVGNLVIHGLVCGLALLSPIAFHALAERGGPVLDRFFGSTGWLARRSMLANLNRMKITSIMFVVSLGGVIAAASVFTSVHQTMGAWLRSNFSGIDLMAASNGAPLSADSVPFSDAALDDIARMPEVAAVEGWRVLNVTHRGVPIRLTAVDPAFYESGLRRFDLVGAASLDAVRALAAGTGVVVNGTFAGFFGARSGATITLQTPTGELEIPVAGVTIDPNDYGTVYVSRELYRQRWADESVTLVSVDLNDGVPLARGAAVLRACCSERYGLVVSTAADFRRELEAILAQVFALLYPGIVISFLIALFSMTNSLLASVEEQMKSIGVVRVVGGSRGQIARSLMLEAGAAGFFSGILGVVVGTVAGYVSTQVLVQVFHMTLLYQFPINEVIFALLASAVLSAVAGFFPGREAAGVKTATILSWE